MAPSKRKHGGGGGGRGRDGGGGGEGKAQKKKVRYTKEGTRISMAATQIAGPGVFVTCVRAKEKRALGEMYDFMNDVADRLYGPEDTSNLPPHDDDNDDDDEATKPPNGTSTATKHDDEEKGADVVVDIAAQIASELDGMRKPKAGRRRFENVDTGTECLLFLSCAPPVDPFELVYAMLEEVERTGKARTRFVLRLSPVADVCLANEHDIRTMATALLPRFFDDPEPKRARTYKIDPRIRSHNVLTRDFLIPLIASCVPSTTFPLPLPDPVPVQDDRSQPQPQPQQPKPHLEQKHTVDLQSPDLLVVVEVLKNVCGIGVLSGYERFKKMNVRSLADAAVARREAAAEAEAGGEKEMGSKETAGDGDAASGERER